MDPEDQAHPGVLAPNVRLALAQLDIRIPQLQDPCTVNASAKGGHD